MPASDLPAIRAHVKAHAGADDARAARALVETVAIQLLALGLYGAAIGGGPDLRWLAFGLELAVGVRVFILFHDAIHGSFFTSTRANRRLATVLQAWIITPAEYWQRNHLAHHRRFGDLGFRDVADTIPFTKGQYLAFPPWKRRFARVVRSPALFFLLWPLYQWWGMYPLRHGNRWVWSGHVAHLLIAWQLSWWHLAALYGSAAMGLVLFHLQHSVGPGYRRPTARWDFQEAALLGSSHLPIPWPLRWATLGIEFHHIHHLNPAVPSYALARCHAEAPPGSWDAVSVGGWRASLAALRNVMWDEDFGRLVPFGATDRAESHATGLAPPPGAPRDGVSIDTA